MADDLIDATGDATTAGKATAKDTGRGKATLVGLRGVAGARVALANRVAAAVDELRPFGEGAAALAEVARLVAAGPG